MANSVDPCVSPATAYRWGQHGDSDLGCAAPRVPLQGIAGQSGREEPGRNLSPGQKGCGAAMLPVRL